jgi:histidyl-tRNA synthetase
LLSFYSDKKHLLTEDSLRSLDIDPMFVLSSTDEDEQILSKNAPSIMKFLKKDSKGYYAKFKGYLDLLNIPYFEDNTLIAENDYNTNSIWEIRELSTHTLIAS